MCFARQVRMHDNIYANPKQYAGLHAGLKSESLDPAMSTWCDGMQLSPAQLSSRSFQFPGVSAA